MMILALCALGSITQAKDQNRVITAVTTNNLSGLTGLIKQKVSLNEVDAQTKNTPLILAVVIKNNAMIKLLIENGAQLNNQNTESNTALHLAVAGGNVEAVELIAKAGANLNIKDSQGRTPLSLAIFRGKECTETLLKYHANPLIQDKDGKTPYDLSVEHNLKDIEKLLGDEIAKHQSRWQKLGTVMLKAPRTTFVVGALNVALIAAAIYRYGIPCISKLRGAAKTKTP